MTQRGSWPEAEVARDIHARLCQDDPVASSELAIAYLDLLAGWLLRTNPRVDSHACHQAAEDAIIALAKNPRSFNPEKGSLDAYLRMSARGDLRNALKGERRHHVQRVDFEDVELFGPERKLVVEETDPARIVERDEDERELLSRVIGPDLGQSFTREEARVLALMLQEERRTSAYSQVLGISELSESEQRREVKRVKDRIKRRMQRARGKT